MDQPADAYELQLIESLKKGDKAAANELFGLYFARVVRAAERRLASRRLHVTNADDIAASVFESIWRRANQDGFQIGDLQSSEEFWRLLCKMTSFKAADHLRREKAQKRGGGILQGESALGKRECGQPSGINDVAEWRLEGADLVVFREEHDRLMGLLDDPTQIRIAVMRLEGYSAAEIAASFSRSERWVRRKLELIRNIWNFEFEAFER